MGSTSLIILILGLIGVIFSVIFLILYFNESRAQRGRIHSLGSRRIREGESSKSFISRNLFQSVKESRVEKRVDSKLTLQKKMKYAQWKVSPAIYLAMMILISLLCFAIAAAYLNLVFQLVSLLAGPLFMNWILTIRIDRRFNAFDRDYAPFLLSVVGLLKTGMNSLQALEAAAQGLEEGSVVKSETELMLERLRYGVPEDKSIGSFGEDIYHPEIELFVQALLLSKRVGGNLSDTLERLSKQVRKRQYFRHSAVAAVGLQRGSIWFILAILVGMLGYLFWMFPDMLATVVHHPIGLQIWQGGAIVILLGIFWVRQVTKIRV